jgi:hypothetical protein
MQKLEKAQPNPHERSFATRKNPRYYKSYAVTPSVDESSIVDASIAG